MRFKLDENLPTGLKSLFSSAGHDCDTAQDEGLVGAEDELIFRRCQEEGRTLVTLDLDFTNIRAYPPSAGRGVIVLRPERQDVASIIDLAQQALLLTKIELPDRRLWIVQSKRIRIRE